MNASFAKFAMKECINMILKVYSKIETENENSINEIDQFYANFRKLETEIATLLQTNSLLTEKRVK